MGRLYLANKYAWRTWVAVNTADYRAGTYSLHYWIEEEGGGLSQYDGTVVNADVGKLKLVELGWDSLAMRLLDGR